MEIRYVTSQIVHRYDVEMAPGQTSAEFVAGLKDGFTLAAPKLELVVTQRGDRKKTGGDLPA